jgi:hypothetical protein
VNLLCKVFNVHISNDVWLVFFIACCATLIFLLIWTMPR